MIRPTARSSAKGMLNTVKDGNTATNLQSESSMTGLITQVNTEAAHP